MPWKDVTEGCHGRMSRKDATEGCHGRMPWKDVMEGGSLQGKARKKRRGTLFQIKLTLR